MLETNNYSNPLTLGYFFAIMRAEHKETSFSKRKFADVLSAVFLAVKMTKKERVVDKKTIGTIVLMFGAVVVIVIGGSVFLNYQLTDLKGRFNDLRAAMVVDDSQLPATSVVINPDGQGVGVLRFKFKVSDPERFNEAMRDAVTNRLEAGVTCEMLDLLDVESSKLVLPVIPQSGEPTIQPPEDPKPSELPSTETEPTTVPKRYEREPVTREPLTTVPQVHTPRRLPNGQLDLQPCPPVYTAPFSN